MPDRARKQPLMGSEPWVKKLFLSLPHQPLFSSSNLAGTVAGEAGVSLAGHCLIFETLINARFPVEALVSESRIDAGTPRAHRAERKKTREVRERKAAVARQDHRLQDLLSYNPLLHLSRPSCEAWEIIQGAAHLLSTQVRGYGPWPEQVPETGQGTPPSRRPPSGRPDFGSAGRRRNKGGRKSRDGRGRRRRQARKIPPYLLRLIPSHPALPRRRIEKN